MERRKIKPRAQQQVINSLRVLDFKEVAGDGLMLEEILLFSVRRDVVISIVTARGTINVMIDNIAADKLAQRLKRVVRARSGVA